MNILIIDTSCEHEIIIVHTDTTFGGVFTNTGFVHSRTLFERIDDVLKKAAIPITEIDLVVCGVGPGSFTGVRIAVTTARTVSQLLNIPLLSLRSPLLYSMCSEFSVNDQILVSFDAKKGKVFGALYRLERIGTIASVVLEEGDYAIDELLDHVSNNNRLVCIGNGSVKYMSTVLERFPQAVIDEEMVPDPEIIVQNCLSLVSQGESFADYKSLLPFYARQSDAEVLQGLKRGRPAD
ncbi:MAG: tRNA (adenosine(37)-N6)-threonylcarbamoyltransferase complex dimerization subunit type 1 TsaB [Spirochaetes bacterium]|nr:tRNA (adenosine(37)-N6)-threonylcarbamoyltransferase complex dimerization subunit type 1 TsaB [Spirochaetota bacterium]